MTAVRGEVKAALQKLLVQHSDEENAIDIMQMAAQEAQLLEATEQVKDAVKRDSFECIKSLKPSTLDRLLKAVEVSEVHRVQTLAGYSSISCTLRLNADVKMKSRGVSSHVSLKFQYERHEERSTKEQDDDQGPSCPSVLYHIDLSRDHGPAERMLWIQVYATGNAPPPHNVKPINLQEMVSDAFDDDDDDGEDGWEDMSEDVENGKDEEATATLGKRVHETSLEEKPAQRSRSSNSLSVDKNEKEDKANEDSDKEDVPYGYVAGVDPDVLARFLQWSQLGDEMPDELSSVYFLMTFPFYEHEFDLIDYLLEAVFGEPEEGDDEDEESDANT